MWNSGSVVQSTSLGADAEDLGAVHAPPVVLRVRADDALGRAGGARGVEDGERVGGEDRRLGVIGGRRSRVEVGQARPGAARDACGQPCIGRGIADDPQRLERRAVELGRRQPRDEAVLDHEQPRRAVAQHVGDLRSHRRGVDRHHRRAEPAAGDEDLDQLDPVREHDRDPVAAADAGVAQASPRARPRAAAGRGATTTRAPKRTQRPIAVARGAAREASPAACARRGRQRLNRHRSCRRGRSPAPAGRSPARATRRCSATSPVSRT